MQGSGLRAVSVICPPSGGGGQSRVPEHCSLLGGSQSRGALFALGQDWQDTLHDEPSTQAPDDRSVVVCCALVVSERND